MGANDKRQPKPFGNFEHEYWKTLEYTARTGQASREIYQREIPLLYQKACYFLDLFSQKGYVAKGISQEQREVYITYEEFKALEKAKNREV